MRFNFHGVHISQILAFSDFCVFADSHVLPLHKSLHDLNFCSCKLSRIASNPRILQILNLAKIIAHTVVYIYTILHIFDDDYSHTHVQ